MGTGITDKRRNELLVSTVNAVEHADGNRCGTQVLTLIKHIGSNDASLVRLAREKDTRELANGQHHRTPPIACGNTCSMTNAVATLNAGERLESPIEHQRKRRLRGIEIGKRTLNGNASAAEKVVGKIARQVNTCGAQGRNGIQGKGPAADSGESSSTA